LECSKTIQIITLVTSKGNIDIKLFGDKNPLTVSNFLENIKKGIYENKSFYKIINYPTTKIIQTGKFSNNESLKNDNPYKLTSTQNIPLEIAFKESSEPLYNKQVIDPIKLKNLRPLLGKGYLAMVKVGKNSSSSTEFFFIINRNSEFNGRYSIFGEVVNGFEILNKLEKKDKILKINL